MFQQLIVELLAPTQRIGKEFCLLQQANETWFIIVTQCAVSTAVYRQIGLLLAILRFYFSNPNLFSCQAYLARFDKVLLKRVKIILFSFSVRHIIRRLEVSFRNTRFGQSLTVQTVFRSGTADKRVCSLIWVSTTLMMFELNLPNRLIGVDVI